MRILDVAFETLGHAPIDENTADLNEFWVRDRECSFCVTPRDAFCTAPGGILLHQRIAMVPVAEWAARIPGFNPA